MTDGRYRTPMRVPALALACSPNGGRASTTAADLFGEALHGTALEPHPDFAARAAIWRDQAAGLISFAEARRRSAAVGVVASVPSVPARPSVRPRHVRPSPAQSRQYAQPMATTAARDDRLTPQAKAFLQVLAARCGKGRETTITKATAGNIMSRSTRTVRRYLIDLIRFGYVEVQTRANARGLHLGLTIRITDLVRPFYEEAKGLARWLAETPVAEFRPFEAVLSPVRLGVTLPPPRNQTGKDFSLRSMSKKLWRELAAKAAPS